MNTASSRAIFAIPIPNQLLRNASLTIRIPTSRMTQTSLRPLPAKPLSRSPSMRRALLSPSPAHLRGGGPGRGHHRRLHHAGVRSITIPLTEVGNYTIYERVPPEYHLLDEEPVKQVTVKYGETAEVDFENEPTAISELKRSTLPPGPAWREPRYRSSTSRAAPPIPVPPTPAVPIPSQS